MKSFAKKFGKIASVSLAAVLSLGAFAACDETPDNSGTEQGTKPAPIVNAPTITVTPNKTSFKKGESITLDIDVSDNGNYDVTVDNPCVSVSGNTLTMTGDIEIDKWITVTVTHAKYPSVTGLTNVTAKAPVVAGKVGELTSELLQEAGNASITVSGKLTDVYENKGGSSSNNEYMMTVKMEEGKWQGTWYAAGYEKNKNVSTYVKGDEQVIDENKTSGSVLLEKYIDKNNEVASKPQTNYLSFPTIWESQHLWNHLGSLNVNKFEYDAQNEVYEYQIDHTPLPDDYFSADEWLMTYLSYSMTPLLEDTLDEFYLVVEGGKITKMLGSTEKLYDNGNGNADDYTTLSYTLIELTFSDIGETEVEDPTPYEAPTNAQQKIYFDNLANALENMQGVKNYTFFATDTTTYKPVTDPDDYEMQSAGTGASAYSAKTASTYASSATGGTASSGTVGQKGFVTEDAIVLATTGKYDLGLDENLYHTTYTGYKKIDESHYDYFTYNADAGKLAGTRRYNGTVSDRTPSFDFSPYVFEFKSMTYNANTESYTYSFVCRDSAITRDLAEEVSMYSYASSAASSATERFTIVVDDKGHVLSTTYPYSVNYGTYLGYVNTVYSDVESTVIPQTVFGEDDEDYIPRVIPSVWGDMQMKNYYVVDYIDNDGIKHYAPYGSAQKYMEEHYSAAERAKLPTIGAFFEIFGDYVSGVFQQDKEVTEGSDTKTVYYWSLTADTERVDEHSHILQTAYEDIIATAKEVLAQQGFTYDPANSSDTIKQGQGTYRIACFSNDTFKIVIENNFTKNFWIYCHKAGDWQLSR